MPRYRVTPSFRGVDALLDHLLVCDLSHEFTVIRPVITDGLDDLNRWFIVRFHLYHWDMHEGHLEWVDWPPIGVPTITVECIGCDCGLYIDLCGFFPTEFGVFVISDYTSCTMPAPTACHSQVLGCYIVYMHICISWKFVWSCVYECMCWLVVQM